MSSSSASKYITWLGRIVTLASIVFFVKVLLDQFSSGISVEWNVELFWGFTVLVAAFSTTGVVAGSAWFLFLRESGEELSLFESIRIFCVSQVGKYVPGNIAHFVGRVALSKQEGVASRLVIVTLFVEALLHILAAALIAILVLVNSNFSDSFAEQVPPLWKVSLAAAVVVAIVLGLSFLRTELGRKLFERIVGDTITSIPRLRLLLLNTLLYAFNLLLLGVALSYLLYLISTGSFANLGWLVGSFAIAYIAGFLTPGAPAGVGIRESIIVLLLSPVFGATEAVTVATLARIAHLLSDGLLFFFFGVFVRFGNNITQLRQLL